MWISIIILCFSIIIHEIGHFLALKIFKVKINTFSIFFWTPKFLLPYLSFKKNNTTYKLGILPLGGFVSFKGQIRLDKNVPINSINDDTIVGYSNKDKDALVNKKVWQRSIVMAGGIIMNFIFAFVIFTITYMVGKEYYTNEIKPIKNYPAYNRLKRGDKIIAVENIKTNDYEDIIIALNKKLKPNKPLKLTILRDKKEFYIKLTPIMIKEKRKKKFVKYYIIGIKPNGSKYRKNYNLITSLKKSAITCISFIYLSINGLKKIFTGNGHKNDLTGPIGIVYVGKKIVSQSFAEFLWFTAIIMMAIGFFNLIPLPILDGGHLFFLLIEKIRGKPLSYKIQAMLGNIFFILFIILGIYILQNDITNICNGKMKV